MGNSGLGSLSDADYMLIVHPYTCKLAGARLQESVDFLEGNSAAELFFLNQP